MIGEWLKFMPKKAPIEFESWSNGGQFSIALRKGSPINETSVVTPIPDWHTLAMRPVSSSFERYKSVAFTPVWRYSWNTLFGTCSRATVVYQVVLHTTALMALYMCSSRKQLCLPLVESPVVGRSVRVLGNTPVRVTHSPIGRALKWAIWSLFNSIQPE